jgi:hypothetical protein
VLRRDWILGSTVPPRRACGRWLSSNALAIVREARVPSVRLCGVSIEARVETFPGQLNADKRHYVK